MSRFPQALRNTGDLPAGPGRKPKTRQQWESEGYTYDRVLYASRLKNKSEAAVHLGLFKRNRYLIVNALYKAFRVKENYSKQDIFARIHSQEKTSKQIVEDAIRECNTRDYQGTSY